MSEVPWHCHKCGYFHQRFTACPHWEKVRDKWTLVSPDDRTFTGETPMEALSAERNSRIPPVRQLERIEAAMRESEEDEEERIEFGYWLFDKWRTEYTSERDAFKNAMRYALREGAADRLSRLKGGGEAVAMCPHGVPHGTPCNDCVICPNCVHQFPAIPVNVQAALASAEPVAWALIEPDGRLTVLVRSLERAQQWSRNRNIPITPLYLHPDTRGADAEIREWCAQQVESTPTPAGITGQAYEEFCAWTRIVCRYIRKFPRDAAIKAGGGT